MSFYTKELTNEGNQKTRLKELVRKAYNAGFLPSIEWRQAEILIYKLPENNVQTQIDYYSRLIASKETSKAA